MKAIRKKDMSALMFVAALFSAFLGNAITPGQLPLRVSTWLPMMFIGIGALSQSVRKQSLQGRLPWEMVVLCAYCMCVDACWHTFTLTNLGWWLSCMLFLCHVEICVDCRKLVADVLAWCAVLCAVVKTALRFGVLPSAFGLFDNEAGYAAALVVCLPACMVKADTCKRSGLPMLLAALCGIVMTNSRAAWFAALLVVSYWLKRKYFASWRVRSWQWCGLALIVSSLLAVLWFLRPASALGRLYMNRVVLEMIGENPLMGQGSCAFRRGYMEAQGVFLSNQGSESPFALLADNVPHAFNEVLSWCLAYGVVGLFLLGYCLYRMLMPMLWEHTGEKTEESMRHTYVCSVLIGVGVLSLTSYPFAYPFAVLATLSVAFFLPKRIGSGRLWQRCVTVVAAVFITSVSVSMSVSAFYWRKADASGMRGQHAEATKYYERAAGLLPQSEELLYNYAADLNAMGNCRESHEVLKRLSLLLNDYDTELLSADNAENLGQTSLSITHLQKAHAMVPNRFFPLWSLFVIEQEMGHWQRAGQLAREIVGKKVKVHSADVEQMRDEAAAWLREQRRYD